MHSSAFYIERLSQVAEIAHRGRLQAQARMRWLDSELAKCPFIAGDHYTIADITAQCALTLGKNMERQFQTIHNILRDGSVMYRSGQPLEHEEANSSRLSSHRRAICVLGIRLKTALVPGSTRTYSGKRVRSVAHVLRRLSEGALEASAHPFAISEPGCAGDLFNLQTALPLSGQNQ